jgi:hypothetical protein
MSSVAFSQNEKLQPFAVVELFTAEGCSSCPPADDLLKEMTDLLSKEGKEVIGLSFHVTYWNKNGWEDPYGQEIFTERQKKYVQMIGTEQVYTPQAVVNGGKEFIGSNPIAFRDEVTAAVSRIPTIEIKATATVENNSLVVEYQSSKVQSNTVLNIALVETNIEHFIPRGENKNRTLRHYNVVRNFSTSSIKANDKIVLFWPKDLTTSNSSVIIYAQNSKSLKITGATQVDLK